MQETSDERFTDADDQAVVSIRLQHPDNAWQNAEHPASAQFGTVSGAGGGPKQAAVTGPAQMRREHCGLSSKRNKAKAVDIRFARKDANVVSTNIARRKIIREPSTIDVALRDKLPSAFSARETAAVQFNVDLLS